MSTLRILAGGGSWSESAGETTESVGGNDVGLVYESFMLFCSFIEFVAVVRIRSMGFDGHAYFFIRHVPCCEGGMM